MAGQMSLLFYRSANSRSPVKGCASGDIAGKLSDTPETRTPVCWVKIQLSFTGALFLRLLMEGALDSGAPGLKQGENA